MKDTFIHRLFHLLSSADWKELDEPAIQSFLAGSESHFGDGIKQLTQSIQSVSRKESNLTFTLKTPMTVPVVVAGMPVQLNCNQTLTTRIFPETLTLASIQGLKAGMGLMKMDLIGVRFHEDGNAFLVDLQTPVKTFNIKIAAF